MKKVYLLLLAVVLVFTMTGCKKKVVLHCDGENCGSAVEFKVKKDTVADESWVVFCEACAERNLSE